MMMSTTLPCRIVKPVATGSGHGPARRTQFFIYLRHGRVDGFRFATKFVD